MSFGRKGLAAGQAVSSIGATAPGRPVPAQADTTPVSEQISEQDAPLPNAISAQESAVDPDEIAARRQAFIASERARRAEAEAIPTRAPKPAPVVPVEDDPLINLRNMSRPEPRPARPMNADSGESGEAGSTAGGLSAVQEAEIRAAARGMARNQPARYGAVNNGGLADGSGGAARVGSGPSSGSGYIFGDPTTRNVGLAYVLWFVLGQFSVHRFYCGQKDSAIFQVGLWFGSLVSLFIFPPLGLIGIVIWMCWIVGDLFMIPGMLAKFKSEHDYRGVFA